MEVNGQIHDPAALLTEAGPPVSTAYGGWLGANALLEVSKKRNCLAIVGTRTRIHSWFSP